MRIATKLRRAVTINTAARKLRQTTITGYERKFRQVVLKFKALSTLFDKVQQSTTQNLKVYQTVTDEVEAWMEHGTESGSKKKTKKTRAAPKKKKINKKKKGEPNPAESSGENSPTSIVPTPIEEDELPSTPTTECEKLHTLIADMIKTHTESYTTTTKKPLQEWHTSVAAVLKSLLAKTRQSRDHLEHYERKVVALQTQLTKLREPKTGTSGATTTTTNITAIDKCSIKLSRNRTKLDSAQAVYETYMAGLEQCSQQLDQAAVDVWPKLLQLLRLEQSLTDEQLATVQTKLIGMVSTLSDTASSTRHSSLQEIMDSTTQRVQVLAPVESVRNVASEDTPIELTTPPPPLSAAPLRDTVNQSTTNDDFREPSPPADVMKPIVDEDASTLTPRTDHRSMKEVGVSKENVATAAAAALVIPSLAAATKEEIEDEKPTLTEPSFPPVPRGLADEPASLIKDVVVEDEKSFIKEEEDDDDEPRFDLKAMETTKSGDDEPPSQAGTDDSVYNSTEEGSGPETHASKSDTAATESVYLTEEDEPTKALSAAAVVEDSTTRAVHFESDEKGLDEPAAVVALESEEPAAVAEIEEKKEEIIADASTDIAPFVDDSFISVTSTEPPSMLEKEEELPSVSPPVVEETKQVVEENYHMVEI